tara:strand:+ start:220 stop:561 length:342 start_codon:yes stop_codon:yes gene_type:complete
MKKKISSLSKSEDFRNILKGKKLANRYFTIFFKKLVNRKNKDLNMSIVTKKKLGNAVKRNKIKRRLKNIMNLAIKKININYNYSYLLIAKKTVLEDEYNNIKQTIFTDFQRIK